MTPRLPNPGRSASGRPSRPTGGEGPYTKRRVHPVPNARVAQAEVKQELTKSGKAAGALSGSALAGWFVLLFLSIAAWAGLSNVMDPGWAGLIVAAVWAVIAAVLYTTGRSKLREVHPKPERTLSSRSCGTRSLTRPTAGWRRRRSRRSGAATCWRPIRWRRRSPGSYGCAPRPRADERPAVIPAGRAAATVLDNFEDGVAAAPLLRRSLLARWWW